jgi:hypothetical protein
VARVIRRRNTDDEIWNAHGNRQHLVAVTRVGFYLRSYAGVPKADGSILSSGQEVFCRPLRIRSDVYGAFVSFQGLA